MKIISWNINALRAHEMVFRNVIQQEKPDIFCLQEIRAREDQLDFRVEGYKSYLNPATLSQYYGTGGLSPPARHSCRLPSCPYQAYGRSCGLTLAP